MAEIRDKVVVGASRELAYPIAQVYGLLTDLRRHWPLLGADLVRAGIVDDTGDESAELVVRGPLPGIQRTIITHVTYAKPMTEFRGRAFAGKTEASIDWQLAERGAHACVVNFSATIEPGGLRDRILVGSVKPWLDRRCRQVLRRLEEELDDDAANALAG
jgi:carbon monoxide dehydrogenase subunit G